MQAPRQGPLEAAVLAVVAASPAPISVADVQRVLDGQPAYTTVMTTMSRLAKKGALVQIRDQRAYRYSLAAPAGSVDDAVVARRMQRLLADRPDRGSVLARFVAALDSEEEQMLTQLLTQAQRAHR